MAAAAAPATAVTTNDTGTPTPNRTPGPESVISSSGHTSTARTTRGTIVTVTSNGNTRVLALNSDSGSMPTRYHVSVVLTLSRLGGQYGWPNTRTGVPPISAGETHDCGPPAHSDAVVVPAGLLFGSFSFAAGAASSRSNRTALRTSNSRPMFEYSTSPLQSARMTPLRVGAPSRSGSKSASGTLSTTFCADVFTSAPAGASAQRSANTVGLRIVDASNAWTPLDAGADCFLSSSHACRADSVSRFVRLRNHALVCNCLRTMFMSAFRRLICRRQNGADEHSPMVESADPPSPRKN